MAYDRTLIQIRERSFLELLDLALVVIRSRPWTLGLAAAAGIVPLALFNAWLYSRDPFPPGIWVLLWFWEAPWATLPLTVVLGGLMFDQRPGVAATLRRLLIALPALILVHVIIRGMLAVTILLIPLIPGRLWFASEVILLERAGPFRALRRCWMISTDRSGEFFLEWIGQFFFGLAFALCFWVGTGAAASGLFESDVTWEQPMVSDLGGLRFQVGVWIAIAFFGVARFLNYIDLRIRSEGWELRLQLQAAGHDLEKGSP
jgi:hypothetical protein